MPPPSTIPAPAKPVGTIRQRQADALRHWATQRPRRYESPAGFRAAGNLEIEIDLCDDPDHYRAVARGQSRAQSAELQTAGSYLVAQSFTAALETALLYASPIRDAATIVRATKGGEMRWPTCNDTSVPGFVVAENTLPQPNPNDVSTFGTVALFDSKWTSGWLLCPVELVEDAAENLFAWLGDLIGRRIARGQNTAFTGAVLAQVTKGRQAISPTALSVDDLHALVAAVDVAYRQRPGFHWQMHALILEAIRNIKDGQGRNLLIPAAAPGGYDMLLGIPVAVNRDMASTMASGNITVALGDFSKVIVKDVKTTRLRLQEEGHADTDQLGFAGFLRSDATLADAGTHPVQYIVH